MRDAWKVHLHFYTFIVILVQVRADAYILKLGQNATLNCTAANNTSTDIKHVKWIKDGTNVASFSDTSENRVTVTDPSKFDLSLPSYTLTIKSAAEEDKGLYNCTVEHTDGNTTSSTIAVAMPGAPIGTSTFPRTSTQSTSAGVSVSARVSTSSVTATSSITAASSTLQTDKPSGTTSSPKLPVVPRVDVDPVSSPSTPGGRSIEPPGKPVALKVTPTSIKLSWTGSQVNDSKVNYTVYVSSGSWSKTKTYTTQDTQLEVRRLIPNTEYFFQVSATDADGNSVTGPQSEPISTKELKPEQKVTNLRGIALNATAIFVSWVRPNMSVANHIKWGYFLSYRPTEANSSRRAASNIKLKRNAQVNTPCMEVASNLNASGICRDLENATISGLLPFTMYKVQVLVYYDFGSGQLVYGDWEIDYTQTAEGVAPVPTIKMDRNETTAYSIGISWTVPSPPVARILGFRIYYCLYSTCPDNQTVITVLGDVRSYVIRDLQPSTYYQISMESFNSGTNSSRAKPFPSQTDVLPPLKPDQLRIEQVSATSINVSWTQPGMALRRVDSFSVLYSQCSLMYLFCALPQRHHVRVVRDGPVQWSLLEDLKPASHYRLNVTAIVRSKHHQRIYVNTSESEKTFLAVSAPTRSPPPVQTTSARTTVEVDDSSGTGAIIGIAIALGAFLVILLVLAAVYFSRKFHQTACYYIDDDGSPRVVKIQHIPLPVMLDGENAQSIAVGQFAKHVSSLHADSDHGFALEYEEIHQSTANRSDLKWEHTMHPDNKHKNRYINIVAYDHSRVQLKPVLGRQKHSDYINANFVDGYEKSRKFIAAQGPLKATFGDFWRMVWEQNTSVIIMLTNLVERGRRKCDQYWPTDGTEQYGLVTVTLKHTKVLANFTIRTFSLRHAKVKKGKAERTVLQYHYTQWPDHGTPDYALPVLTFIRKSAAVRGGEDVGPMVVHCSAGVGRTGTYIVLDTMMRQVEEKHSVNIKGFLKHIRTQRNYLVQTEEQYIFCHDALLKFIQCRDTEIPENQLHHYMDELLKPGRSGRTLLDKHFKHMMAHQAEEFEYYCAQKPCNTKKNRTQKLLPVECTRVCLTAKPGMEGSDYINASYLQGYNRSKEFIVTQHPLPDTVKDFWQMIWDQNSPAVVMLSKPDEVKNGPQSCVVNDNLPSYWPSKDKPMECVTFKVSLQDEKEEKIGNDIGVTVRSFLLEATQKVGSRKRRRQESFRSRQSARIKTSFRSRRSVRAARPEHDGENLPLQKTRAGSETSDDYVLEVRHFQSPDWPAACTAISDVFHLINLVQDHAATNEGPITVHDVYGGVSAATFCGLTAIKHQLEDDGSMDIFQLAKTYHMMRPGVFSEKDQYLFLYKAMQTQVAGSAENGDIITVDRTDESTESLV
ncbi:receptor-type tyrosine-protein phosphatase zeta-like isoform X4 [Branchiostoma lanceolatum]|uniref:receptor-type tyrosine-protein phosphatase zeta-like isoform X4 n=1 Tax=Branchiostoma lanceolatum TaxID=7740 RepID=UPI00345232C4